MKNLKFLGIQPTYKGKKTGNNLRKRFLINEGMYFYPHHGEIIMTVAVS